MSTRQQRHHHKACLICGHVHVGKSCNPRVLAAIDAANRRAEAEESEDDVPARDPIRSFGGRLADAEQFRDGRTI